MDDCPNEDCIPPGTDYTYAVDRIELEAQGLNLDGDPQNLPDNELGRFLEAISFRVPELDVQALIDESIASGRLVLLNRVNAWGFDRASFVHCWWYLGDANHELLPDSPGNVRLMGTINDGIYTGGPGEAIGQLSWADSGTPLRVRLVGARVHASIDETEIGTYKAPARLAGGIAVQDFFVNVLPDLFTILGDLVATDCANPCACEPGSAGAIALQLFDDQPDCAITFGELQNSSLLAELTLNALDLLDAAGHVSPRSDQAVDSFPIALGFTSKAASFDFPLDPNVDR
jgi:hypothetical protein